MLREKGTLNTKDAPQLPLSLTPRCGGGACPEAGSGRELCSLAGTGSAVVAETAPVKHGISPCSSLSTP